MLIPYSELTAEIAAAGCLVIGMPSDDYHAYPAWNKSSLDLIARSPAHYKFSAPREASRAMEIGSAVHAAVLEPEVFKRDYVLLQDVTDRRSSVYKEAVKVHGSASVLTGTEAVMVECIRETVQHDIIKRPGHAEISVFATCSETGLLIKCRFDYLTLCGAAIDLKTTQDSRASEFAKSVYNYRYHVQDAFYRHVYRCATGKELNSFSFLAVEKEAPYFSAVYEIDQDAQEIGKYYALRDLKTASECERSGHWPMPSVKDEPLQLPSWAYSQYESDIEESIS